MSFKLDTDSQVFFYEQEFYVLSNFAAFQVQWCGLDFPTSEHAYHWTKFAPQILMRNSEAPITVRRAIRLAKSAHESLKIAEQYRNDVRLDWKDVRTSIMREILRNKARQHEYVRRKLLETGTRELIEDSWRDNFWGWGPNRDGQNMLGKLWMEIRAELTAATPPTAR